MPVLDSFDPRQLEEEIDAAYRRSGNKLGWRFLYSPESMLAGADLAFIGLNPGGDTIPTGHAEFAMDRSSAYATERWKSRKKLCLPGKHPLQVQILSLFRRLGARPEEVLAGNLVPFRSPCWDALVDKRFSLEFGCSLWRRVLHRARPSIVVSMGGKANEAIAKILQVDRLEAVPVH
jgi:hypothetical protein